jgi:hypothetical protein
MCLQVGDGNPKGAEHLATIGPELGRVLRARSAADRFTLLAASLLHFEYRHDSATHVFDNTSGQAFPAIGINKWHRSCVFSVRSDRVREAW